MARDHVPCARNGCRSAGEWIAWFDRTRPLVLCYRCLQHYYRAEELWIVRPSAVPLLIGLN